jgi:PRTRC genetic system protein E
MDFFKTIAEHLHDGQQLTLTIKKSGEKLVASILPDISSIKDKAVSDIAPLVMSGTPEDFEMGFAEALEPIDKALGLVSDVSTYEKEVDAARAKTEMENKKKDEAKKMKKQYTDFLALAKKNIDAKKFKDARLVLDKAAALSCSDKKEIDTILADIDEKMGAGSLFGEAEDKSDGKDIALAGNSDQEEEVVDRNDDNENEED